MAGEAIEAEELQPNQLRETNRKRYENTFLRVIQSENPISDSTRSDLKHRQRDSVRRSGWLGGNEA